MFDKSQTNYVNLRSVVGERTRELLVWTGSGLSIPAGLPSWKGLRDSLCEALLSKARTLEGKAASDLVAKHDIISREKDLWTCFDMLKSSLGITSYKTIIRRALAPADTATVPNTYNQIWKLRPKGVLNLNLDRLASKAYNLAGFRSTLHEFSGNEAGRFLHLLQSPSPFVANLHGVSADESTWAFTRTELSSLMDNSAYRAFIATSLISRTILFVGLSADDVAVRGHLDTLKSWGIEMGAHYWITSRADGNTDVWAENTGILPIRYRASGGDHSDLGEFFDDLATYLPQDTAPLPVTPTMTDSIELLPELPDVAVLRRMDNEAIRQILNAHAAKILNSDKTDKYDRYEDFCRKYNSAIHNAWFLDLNPPDNILLGYKVTESIARGSFGRVYRAKSSSGEEVAIKLLHAEVRNDSGMLQSFRRGVSSMRILSNSQVSGMIAYRQASEIPAFVVMELVDGLNLTDAVRTKTILEWSNVLRIAVRLSQIIRSAHSLSERVLHRDIRPSNVMLRDHFLNPDTSEVVVLDFDLSWHKDASEKSIVANTMSGFLAPEQITSNKGSSTRNALVDSYGVGMTFFFLRTALEPNTNQHRHSDWESTLAELGKRHPCNSWQSLPVRFGRLIFFSTRDTQSERWDMAQIQGELERLRDAEKHPEQVKSAELLTEEVVYRSELQNTYKWDQDSLTARAKLPNGVEVKLTSQETKRVVELDVVWSSLGSDDRKIGKFLTLSVDKMFSALKSSGWNPPRLLSNTATRCAFSSSIRTDQIAKDIAGVAKSLDATLKILNLRK